MEILADIVFLLILSPLVIGLILLIKPNRKKEKEAKEPESSKKVEDLIPHSYYDTELDAYVLSDGNLMNIFKINAKDLYSISDDEQQWDAMRFAKLYQTYPDDLKVYALNFPTNTFEQQEYWKHKIDTTINPIIKRQQEEKLFQLQWLQSNSTKREFFLVYFGKDKEQLKKHTNDILAIMGTGRDGLLEIISPGKKHQIFFKLANKSSQIFLSKDLVKKEKKI